MASHLGLRGGLEGSLAAALPVTGAALVPFSAYFILLTTRIAFIRIRTGNVVGSRLKTENREPEDPTDPLYCAIRSFGNYTENLPLALLLSAVAELNGADKRALTRWLATYFVFRLLHVELGLLRGMYGLGRPLGYYGGNIWLMGMAWWNWTLCKGYWSA